MEDKNLDHQSFLDQFLYGVTMIHFDQEGNATRIAPLTEKWWEIKDKLDDKNNS